MEVTVGQLLRAYRLLRETLPLARAALVAGGVSLEEQEGFWSAYIQFLDDVDANEEDADSPAGLDAQIDELEDQLWKEAQTKCDS